MFPVSHLAGVGPRPSGGSSGGGGRGGGGDEPLGPHDPGGPNHAWFRSATFDPNKFDPYLFDDDHVANQGKAKGWRDVFGIGTGDGPLLERLIKEQLEQAEIEEKQPRAVEGREVLRWELVIPEFRGPNGNFAPVLTAFAHDPNNERPHFVTAIAQPDRAG